MSELAKLIEVSQSTVIFSGAGMSTESGLMDFRSADRGMWNNRNPIELADIEAIGTNRDEFIRFYKWRVQEMNNHQPNEGHHMLADWERRGLINGIITQNVENYHDLAGTRRIAKLHGDLGTMRCMNCNEQYSSQIYLPSHETTSCSSCGGFIRPNVVLFGEMLSQTSLQFAAQLMREADLFIVLGSSLSVSPANQFPMQAKANGAKLVIVNYEPTATDRYADLVIHESIGATLREADAALGGLSRLG
ncbi:NAD-dependent deacetylase [Paenibacillus cellulosilyticus]|uniref:protein acetyllysine N-acetyltransferase n=1 Tax=Paenibacillus cellulosilyticus TaxID=375489 RepID=A0A2V2YSB4_9BACL|nr:NAD-dependent deacylase [Paenibacillus cellulosilyticus]PWW01112.1 NAD-dependent deacetylase [Paenibacillus cellulosilyticus]QKS46917.1 NAD-dependent deacylase [Paenibacillus cellulosilyticus]